MNVRLGVRIVWSPRFVMHRYSFDVVRLVLEVGNLARFVVVAGQFEGNAPLSSVF